MSSFASLLAGYANRNVSSPSGNNGGHQTKPEKEQPTQIVGPYYHRIQAIANESTHNLSTITTSEPIPFGGLGILIIIVDSLPHEILWRLWLDHYTHHHSPPTIPSQSTSSSSSTTYQHQPSTVNIWIHAKHPERITSPWVQQRLVTGFQLRPSWGSVELTEVMVHMLAEAMACAPHLTKFCFASESCIPVVSVHTTFTLISHHQNHVISDTTNNGNRVVPASTPSSSTTPIPFSTIPSLPLIDDECSWIKWSHHASNGYAQQQQFEVLRKVMPSPLIVKGDQWVLLSRAHAQQILALSQRILHDTNSTPSSSSSSTKTTITTHNHSYNQAHAGLLKALFKQVKASDEMFFPCCLSILGLIPPEQPLLPTQQPSQSIQSSQSSSEQEQQLPTNVVLRRQLTYCVWGQGDRSPMTFEAITTSLLHSAQSQGSVFLRKLRPPRTPYTLAGSTGGTASHSDGQNDGTGSKQNTMSSSSGEGQTWLETWCTSVLKIGISRPHPLDQDQAAEEDVGWTMTDCCAKIAAYEMEIRQSTSSRSVEESRKRSRSPTQ